MFEDYLEKNILRQLFLCDQFYNKKEIDIDVLSKLLQVCKTTLLNDIKDLKKELEPEIIYTQREKNRYFLYFAPDIPRFLLMQKLARSSLFLKTCQLYLEKEPNYIQLTETEYISVSKAYSLKKQVLAYFEDCGIKIQNGSPKFTEIERRLLLLNITYRTGTLATPILPKGYLAAINDFINKITYKSGRIYDKENQEILRMGFLIGYLYQAKFPLMINIDFMTELKKRPSYHYVTEVWKQSKLKDYYQENEVYFILILFNLCDYGFNSYQAVEEDFYRLHQVFIDNNHEIKELITQFEVYFNRTFVGNKAFERALFRLMRSAWDNYQLFMPEKFSILTPKQQALLNEIQPLFKHWLDQLPYSSLRINSNCMNTFVVKLSAILRIDKTQLHICIVTNSDIKYLIYREALEAVATLDIKIEPTIHSQLNDELKDFAKKENHRILCERTLYTPEADEIPTIIPVSVDNLEKSIIWALK
ncbi:DNA-binding protein [Enterococcus ratti]|uniref:DNA-binding protein n=1 Tax=Enterococcus ratti TaxID=150033 RepID=UPI003512B71E